jgi:hypothetical protein
MASNTAKGEAPLSFLADIIGFFAKINISGSEEHFTLNITMFQYVKQKYGRLNSISES